MRNETKRRQRGHPAPPVSASYMGESSFGPLVRAGSPEYPVKPAIDDNEGRAAHGCAGLLRMAGGGEDRPLVVFQDFQPGRYIGGVVVAGLRRDAKIGA